MRILHIVPTYYPATYWGGPIFSVYSLNNELAKFPDVQLEVLTTDAAGPAAGDTVDSKVLSVGLFPGYTVHFAHRILGKSFSLGMILQMVFMIGQADVVHLTGVYSPPTMPTLLFCRIFKKPLVWSPRGAILEAFEWKNARRRVLKRIWDKLCNILIKQGNIVMHVTSAEKERSSLARLPKARAINIKNGVQVPKDLPMRKWQPNGKTRLLFIGRIHPKKGIENLLEAMKILENADVDLRIYGTGDEKYINVLKQQAHTLGLLKKSVFFMGHVESVAKERAFLNADICVVPSHSENFGIVIAEALAHGVPVIASKYTPWKELEEKQCGLWVDNTPDSLSKAILELQNKNLQVMGENGWEWMKEDFSWGSIAISMYNTYEKLLSLHSDGAKEVSERSISK